MYHSRTSSPLAPPKSAPVQWNDSQWSEIFSFHPRVNSLVSSNLLHFPAKSREATFRSVQNDYRIHASYWLNYHHDHLHFPIMYYFDYNPPPSLWVGCMGGVWFINHCVQNRRHSFYWSGLCWCVYCDLALCDGYGMHAVSWLFVHVWECLWCGAKWCESSIQDSQERDYSATVVQALGTAVCLVGNTFTCHIWVKRETFLPTVALILTVNSFNAFVPI